MGYRLKLSVLGKIVYSRSYPSRAAAERAGPHTKWWTGEIIKS